MHLQDHRNEETLMENRPSKQHYHDYIFWFHKLSTSAGKHDLILNYNYAVPYKFGHKLIESNPYCLFSPSHSFNL